MEYTNPVFPGYFADPFVWNHRNIWYAIGTGPGSAAETLTRDGQPGTFLLLKSTDMVHWIPVGSALRLLDSDYGNSYWAPEIAYAEGRFWLYYSVGREDKSHHIRVAVSDDPEGPWIDCGDRITNPFTCPFAIDASPFLDDDGQWYLFYARDFLDTESGFRVGTGVVVDRLIDMRTLAHEERVVVRAQFDWQRYQSGRIMYGNRFDWHTVEGPSVCKRDGRYWCLFSAGRWENETYGVDWAVSNTVGGPWTYDGSEDGARLLRTVPDQVIGPGHNSIARSADGKTDYIVYHAWDSHMTARRMFIDLLKWTSSGPRCSGPTLSSQILR